MKKIFLIAIVILLTVGVVANVSAQDLPYYFQVSKEVVNVYWNSDGTQSIEYTWVFKNQFGSHSIDFVDVGMPNSNFDTNLIKADVNGGLVSVSRSDYQGNGSGFAIVLGTREIPAGGTGTVHVIVDGVTNTLYTDTSDKTYVSVNFTPTWFGSKYVTGKTDLTIAIHLPPNMKQEEPRWHKAPSAFPSEPQGSFDENNRVTYTWYSPSASASETYLFGASFPKSYVPAGSVNSGSAPAISLPSISVNSDTVFNTFCVGFFLFIFFGIPAISASASSRRRMQYLPPKISIEGHGIKRGLTAVEAAILMQQPLDKIMTMILFGVIKKNAAQVVTRDPLELSVAAEPPADLHQYEWDFLKAFKEKEAPKRRRALEDTMVNLVRSISEKMRGFSLKETTDYYKSIMEKAWQQIEAADTPEVKSQKLDETLEWTMLDKDYDERTRRTGPIIVPTWWGNYNPTYTPNRPQTGGGLLTSMSNQPSGRSALPGADFAAQMVTGVQTFSQKVVGNVNTFTERVTGTTNPPPKPTSSGRSGGRSGGSGGGRSCACACACAGCACACAGGGR